MTVAKQSGQSPERGPMEVRRVTLKTKHALDLYNAFAALDGQRDVKGEHVVVKPYRISGPVRLAIGRNKAMLRAIKEAAEEAQNGVLLELSGGSGVLMPTVQDDNGKDIPNVLCAEYHRRTLDIMNESVGVDLFVIAARDILPDDDGAENEIPPSVLENLTVVFTEQ